MSDTQRTLIEATESLLFWTEQATRAGAVPGGLAILKARNALQEVAAAEIAARQETTATTAENDQEESQIDAAVWRCDQHNKQFRSLWLVSGPAYVLAHFESEFELYGQDAMNLLAALSENGHRYTITTNYIEISPVEFMNL